MTKPKGATMSIELGLTIAGFVIALIGYGVKYGADKQQLASENMRQDQAIDNLDKIHTLRIDSLERAASEEKQHNAKQHEEFYSTLRKMDRMEEQMKTALAGINEIKRMLGAARRSGDARDRGEA